MILLKTRVMLCVGILLSLASQSTCAEDLFGQRVQRAKLVEESEEGKHYQKEMWGRVGNYTAKVMQQCFPEKIKADTDAFTLVADVMNDCHLSRVEVRPKTKMAQCFANKFSYGDFPRPPDTYRKNGMPIEIDMKITH